MPKRHGSVIRLIGHILLINFMYSHYQLTNDVFFKKKSIILNLFQGEDVYQCHSKQFSVMLGTPF